jgi:hypothetical protein
VVLPNGEAVTASEESNPDLFWALRGAGHNFGIVTEWEYRIYDIRNPKWSYEVFIFLGDKLEELLEWTQKMMKTQPPHLIHWQYIVNIPEIDPQNVSPFLQELEASLTMIACHLVRNHLRWSC